MKLTYEQIEKLWEAMLDGDEVTLTLDPETKNLSCLIRGENGEDGLVLISEDGDIL